VTKRIQIGTSGWTYDSWRGPFYPEEVARKRWLQYYSQQFTTVEVNGSFYRTPSLEAVRLWRDSTPDDFVFAWKASKFITHWKRLSDQCRDSLALMETRLRALGSKVGPVLFQLPARFKADRERLATFLQMLSKRRKYSFEFRDSSWFEDNILAVLREWDIALCFSDHKDAPTPWIKTAGHVYVRGHGPTGEYKDHYTDRMLRGWARQLAQWKQTGSTIYCYFDNDQKSAAPHDGRRLQALLKIKRAVSSLRM
jgi:uncharacterized protein YecE (DUF72 family)